MTKREYLLHQAAATLNYAADCPSTTTLTAIRREISRIITEAWDGGFDEGYAQAELQGP